MCIVAEIFFGADPTAPGETPDASDNLAQRNLAILHSDNPGGPDSHTVMHTLEVKPSELPAKWPSALDVQAFNELSAVGQRLRLDELIFRWHKLPADSEVTVYFSDIDTADIQRLASFRRSVGVRDPQQAYAQAEGRWGNMVTDSRWQTGQHSCAPQHQVAAHCG